MIKIIQFLQENESILELIIEKKASLLGVTELECQSILCSFEEEICQETLFWG
ncbi:competence pheromone ComX [Solibacillus sp. MA9]|uniref:ComX pheromone n=1 Tax=Solibacillus palustris TaxID=2908203 RepID=A0ABS9UI31_9BACL|nr:competence pheromone ComX [Solibacillus sp. MA9]MCH7324006.1 competence pheromone ComX [Solibacillus sp. MA9]